jgi:hypothetical protein
MGLLRSILRISFFVILISLGVVGLVGALFVILYVCIKKKPFGRSHLDYRRSEDSWNDPTRYVLNDELLDAWPSLVLLKGFFIDFIRQPST